MFVARAPVVIEEEPITDAAGGEHWLATTKVPLVNASGRVTHVVGIIHDITQLRAAQRELQAANQELEAYGYSVSHDLHAPLRSIRGFARALAEDVGADLPANSRAHLDRILAATERMSALIDQILQLSRVGRAEIARQAVDLGAIARDVVVECRAAEPSRQVEVDIAAPLPCSADPVLARILVQNLVGNAWKFTRDAPAARIEFWRDAQGRFTVRDNGAGFPPGAASRLFRPFQRLHGASEFPGTGLGLASVRRIVERHGGQVGASSTPGHGAAFWFTLPAGVGALAS
jgi:signal transduction histidine kinase